MRALEMAGDRDRGGARGFAWPVDSAGTHLGWGLLKLTPGDMAKIGTLMLNDGAWEGTQIVSPAWVTESTHAQVATSNDQHNGIWPEYGYHWWVTTAGNVPAYLAYGFGGQMIEVVPELDLVVVVVRELDLDDPGADAIDPTTMTDLVAEVIVPQLR